MVPLQSAHQAGGSAILTHESSNVSSFPGVHDSLEYLVIVLDFANHQYVVAFPRALLILPSKVGLNTWNQLSCVKAEKAATSDRLLCIQSKAFVCCPADRKFGTGE